MKIYVVIFFVKCFFCKKIFKEKVILYIKIWKILKYVQDAEKKRHYNFSNMV